jgi:quercetin dioxygenase-like cupin family protein
VLRFEPGAGLANYRRDNEQLAFIVDGELEIDLNDEEVEAAKHCVVHLPPGTQHELVAPHGAVIVLAQDRGLAAG